MSLYCPDTNSKAAAMAMRSARGENIVSVLAELELLNALQLRAFRREITLAEADGSWKNLESDLRGGIYHLAGLTDAVFERARLLSRQSTARLGTRTADVLHVAAALELCAGRLYSFDQQQRKLARSVGLKVN